MPGMLRHKPTGDLYIFTDILAKRSDMELVQEAGEVEHLTEEPNEVVENQVEEVVEEPARKPGRPKKTAPVDELVVESVEAEEPSLGDLLEE